MNRKLIITGAVFVVVVVVALALEQYVLHLQGAVVKLIIGVVVALIAAGIAYMVVKTPTAA